MPNPQKKPQKPRLVIVDATSYVFRAFHALPPLNNKAGMPTGALYGFINMIAKLLADESPERIAIVFDAAGPTFRDEAYSEYKAGRAPMPPDLVLQIPYVRKVVDALRLPCLEVSGVEADDVIATLVERFDDDVRDVLIVTSDKDMTQLVTPRVTLLDTMRNRRTGVEEVRARFGVEPSQVVEVLGLVGDSVDNVPGVKGIGEKTAQALIRHFGSIENLLAKLPEVETLPIRGSKKIRECLEREADCARMSRELVCLRSDVPLETMLDDLRLRAPDFPEVRTLFTELGFQSLVAKIAPGDTTKSGLTGWVEDRRGLVDLVCALAGRERVSVELVVDDTNRRIEAVAFGLEPGEACVVKLGGEGRLALGDLAAVLGAEAPRKIGGDLKQTIVVLGRAGVVLGGLYSDVSVASYVVNPSRQTHRVDDLALEFLGRNLGAPAEDTADARLEAAAERARTVLALEALLAPDLAEQQGEKLFREIEMPLLPVLARMERRGVRIDRDHLAALGAEFDQRMSATLAEIYALAGTEFNVGSPPQLREVLFGKLKLSVRGVRRGKTGLSTDVDVLTRLAREHPLPEKILSYRALAKLKSTYIDALPALIDPETGRVHTSFNQTVAATGRLSSSDPNLQNIPIRTEEGRRIRAAFLPAEGHRLLSADYSQIELRLLAHLSGDPTLVDSFRRGEDIHRRTAAEVFRRPLDQVSANERRAAKVINFGILYGMGPVRLSKELEIAHDEAERYIESYFARYPGVSAFMQTTLADARRTGFVTTLLGRRRFIPDLSSPEGGVRQFAERTAVNTPIQGTAADLIKVAMIRIDQRLAGEGFRAAMTLQVHDELILDVPEDEVEQVSELVRREMEGVASLAVPLDVSVAVGANWAELH